MEAMDRCPACGSETTANAFFCSNCGKQLRSRPESVSLGRQLIVYAVSFFLAPFGLFFAFRYLRQKDPKARIIGWVSVILTLAAVGVTVLTAKSFLGYVYRDLRTINSLIY